MEADTLKSMNFVQGAFAAVTAPTALQRVYSEQVARVKIMDALYRHDYVTASTGGMKGVDASIQLYHALVETGLLD